MRIMTFNTQHCKNFITQKIDFQIMADAIKACNADIVGLNEMRGLGADPAYQAQVEKLAELTGMQYYFFAPAIHLPNGPYGNGFLSKYPVLKAEIIPIPDPAVRGYSKHYETRCVLKLEIEGGITVLVTHFGLNPDEQELAVRTVLSCITERKCILMGDFNMRPQDPILQPIFEVLIDTATVMGEEKLSFPSDAPIEKIDYIFLSSDAKLISADIPAIVASDHRPHTAVVEF